MKNYTSLQSIQADLYAGDITCRQLVEFYLQNIAEKNNQTLDELDFLMIKKVEKSVERDVLKMFDLKNSVNSKKSYGGTSPFNVNKMIKKYQKEFK